MLWQPLLQVLFSVVINTNAWWIVYQIHLTDYSGPLLKDEVTTLIAWWYINEEGTSTPLKNWEGSHINEMVEWIYSNGGTWLLLELVVLNTIFWYVYLRKSLRFLLLSLLQKLLTILLVNTEIIFLSIFFFVIYFFISTVHWVSTSL